MAHQISVCHSPKTAAPCWIVRVTTQGGTNLKKSDPLWSRGISLLKPGLCVHLCFHGCVLFFILFASKHLSVLREWNLWLHNSVFISPVQSKVSFVLGTTNMDPQGSSSMAGASVCPNPDLWKHRLWIDVHPTALSSRMCWIQMYIFNSVEFIFPDWEMCTILCEPTEDLG